MKHNLKRPSLLHLLPIIGGLFCVHSIRNYQQYYEVDTVLTRFGDHDLAVTLTNSVLSPFGLEYQRSQELVYFGIELCLGVVAFVLCVYMTRAKSSPPHF